MDRLARLALIRAIGVKQYYRDRRRAYLVDRDASADAWFELDVVRRRRVAVKRKLERLALIREIVEKAKCR